MGKLSWASGWNWSIEQLTWLAEALIEAALQAARAEASSSGRCRRGSTRQIARAR